MPVATEPVKVILSMHADAWLVVRRRHRHQLITLMTPAGTISRNNSPIRNVVNGVYGDGLITMRITGQQRHGDID